MAIVTKYKRTDSRPQITFDDGVQSQFRFGLPAMQQNSVTATFFVNAGMIEVVPEYMTWEQLRETLRQGHRIQSHGWSHAYLPDCADAQLDEELRRSKQTLEDKLGTLVDEISMPGGRWDSRVIKACAQAGYRRVYLSDPWVRYNSEPAIEVVGRLMVRSTRSSQELEKALKARGFSVTAARARYRAKEAIKSFMGHSLYHRLWLALSGYNRFANQTQRTPELDFRQKPK
jgi:peptidoglycan/xylan/chitin deacetylase (PgdA/CDA1 family)